MAVNEDIARRIRATLVRALSAEIDEEELARSDRLDDVIAIDSIAGLEFVVALEAEFGITIDADHLELEFLGDVDRLGAYIEEAVRRTRNG